MTAKPIVRDERTVATENASYRWAYFILTYGLLVSVAYRAYARNEASWDLVALVIVSGGVANLYQARGRILTRRWALASIAAMLIAAVIAALAVILRH